MQIHELKRNTENRKKKTVGRGGKRGKTSGRGTKGQNSRAGRKKRPELRDIIKKLPKRRGYRFNSIQQDEIIVKIAQLEKVFNAGEEVNPKTLVEKKVIGLTKGKSPKVKILGSTPLTKPVKVSNCLVSKGAKAIIEKAGGQVL